MGWNLRIDIFGFNYLSTDNPIKNGFPVSETKSYAKHTMSAVEFQNKIVGQEVQYSFYESKNLDLSKRAIDISHRSRRPLVRLRFHKEITLSDSIGLNFDFFPGVYKK